MHKLVFRGNDKNFNYESQFDLDKLGPIDYNDMHMRFIIVIKKVEMENEEYGATFDDINAMSPYFTIYYNQNTYDFYKRVFKTERIGVRACRQEDFGDTDKVMAKELFESWKGYILACPDIKDDSCL